MNCDFEVKADAIYEGKNYAKRNICGKIQVLPFEIRLSLK
jgi:hypothetical protein